MRLLLVFTRFPEPGKVKTRLIPRLGPAGAAELHRAMTEHTLRRVSGSADAIEVRHEGGDEPRMREWLGAGVALRAQGEGDLGARLARAFAEGFARGADAVAAIGTDCPGIGKGDVVEAFEVLAGADAVFGPAADGGYWLVGLGRSAWAAAGAAVFAGIPWGGPRVLEESRAAAANCGVASVLLRTLADVDRPGDLAVWEAERGRGAGGEPGPAISVVVPTLEEAGIVGPLVRRLLGEPGVEVVVADGGSSDGSAAEAASAGARVVSAPRGRAAQMNAGAAVAAGRVLLFLHADTALPPGYPSVVLRALEADGVAGGAFSFATDSPKPSLRLIERLANWRGRRFGIVFGDQGIFVRREVFDAVGGYPEQPLMEDRELVRRLRGRGSLVILEERAVTSARRWHARGPWRTTLRNFLITWSYELGVSPERLAARYRGKCG